MNDYTLISLCWIALGLSALVGIGAAAIGAAYTPEHGAKYLGATLGPVIGVAGLLFLLPRTSGVLWLIVLFATACTGLALVGFFGHRLVVDSGDAMLWVPPLLLGLGLLVLVLRGGPRGGSRGDT